MGIFDRIRELGRTKDREKVWGEAYKEKEVRERTARIENKAREIYEEEEAHKRADEMRTQGATNRGVSTFPSTLLLENVRNPHFWWWVFAIFIFLVAAWWTNFLRFRDIMFNYGFTLIGLMTVVVMICFILYGWFVPPYNLAKFYIATALFIWIIDLAPENTFLIGQYLGPEYQGFVFNLISSEWSIDWAWNVVLLPILASSATFAFLYINMVYKIIKKEYIAFILSFGFILLFNYLTNQLPTYLRFGFTIPYGKVIFFALLIGIGLWAWKKDKKRTGEEIPEFFSALYLIIVFSFFWLNTGWQGNIKAWAHVIFIIAFGFSYIKAKASNPAIGYISIASLLIFDFYGYGLLYSSDILALQFIPPFALFVIWYCYDKEVKSGEKNYTYPVAAFILLVTFILLMSVSVGGTTTAEVPFVEKKSVGPKDAFTQFTERLKDVIEGRLDIATGGLYRGNVEKNMYESLGVYFGNLRAADPRFYDKEPITVWGTIRSKTYKDAVVINFSCYRLKDNKRIMADKIVPDIKFPIFTLEEVDTECVFYPSTEPKIQPGANMITFSAEYNFGTDAYLKAYFIDRDRFRAYAREDVDPLKEFGIKDKKPVSISTNGPVEIGIGTGEPLITVSEGYAIKPTIGITLTNRQEIQDKDKKIITRWEGKIKNITELVLLVPPGITLENIESCKSQDKAEKLKCPCSMPFEDYDADRCANTCTLQVSNPCKEACISSYTDKKESGLCEAECDDASDRCVKECDFLFKIDEGEGSANEKYKGYALDVGSLEFKDLNKDIDKHRSFQCRFAPSQEILDAAPITTRYFRVRARYNYLLENSVAVNVEATPTPQITTVPTPLFNLAAESQDLWFEGVSSELIAAIASVESNFRHCCQEIQAKGTKCTPTNDKSCDFNKLITSGTSYGIMQVKYNTEKTKAEVNQLIERHCAVKNIADYDCNVRVGMAILKTKYDIFKNGCKETSEYKSGNTKKYPTLINACNICTSTIGGSPYSSYTGYRAAVRGYNGWGCDSRFDRGYVEKAERAMKTVKGAEIIDPSTLKSIFREGEGMYDITSLTETQTSEKPSPPIGPIAYDTPKTRNSITISWGSSQTPNVRYLVDQYKQQTGESKNLYDGTETIYVDTDVEDGISYYYKITAYSDFEKSDPAVTNVVKSIDDV